MIKYSILSFALLCCIGCSNEAAHSVRDTSVVRESSATAITLPSEERVSPVESTAMAGPNSQRVSTGGRPYRRSWLIDQVGNSRFRASGMRYASGELVLVLDTAYQIHADSLQVSGLARGEGFANTCRYGTAPNDNRLVGIMRDTIHEQWLQPRLAWVFDTLAVRIKSVPVGGVACMLETPD